MVPTTQFGLLIRSEVIRDALRRFLDVA